MSGFHAVRLNTAHSPQKFVDPMEITGGEIVEIPVVPLNALPLGSDLAAGRPFSLWGDLPGNEAMLSSPPPPLPPSATVSAFAGGASSIGNRLFRPPASRPSVCAHPSDDGSDGSPLLPSESLSRTALESVAVIKDRSLPASTRLAAFRQLNDLAEKAEGAKEIDAVTTGLLESLLALPLKEASVEVFLTVLRLSVRRPIVDSPHRRRVLDLLDFFLRKRRTALQPNLVPAHQAGRLHPSEWPRESHRFHGRIYVDANEDTRFVFKHVLETQWQLLGWSGKKNSSEARRLVQALDELETLRPACPIHGSLRRQILRTVGVSFVGGLFVGLGLHVLGAAVYLAYLLSQIPAVRTVFEKIRRP